MRREEGETAAVKIAVELDRRGEAAVDRQHRTLADAGEFESAHRLAQDQHDALYFAAIRQRKRQVAAILADQAKLKRNDHRLFRRLAGRRRHVLFAVEYVGLARRIVAAGDRHLRRAGLAVPAHELRHVATRRVGEALDELFDGRGMAVVAGEIEIHAGAEFLPTDQRLHHAHHFGAFLVHGAGVEVIDVLIGFRPDRMGQRTGVLDELRRAQAAHNGNAFDRPRAHVGGKFLVAENREAFLQAELEPVAASDAVAGPLWKYSCAITASICAKSASVAVSPLASTYLSLKTLRPLFSMAPMLKSDTATIMKISRSYSRPKASSSQRIERLSESMA